MTISIVRGGQDTWALRWKPNVNRRNGPRLRVCDNGGTKESVAFIHKPNPVPRGATVFSATLRVTSAQSWPGEQTLILRKVTEKWKVGRVTWNTRPASTLNDQKTVTKQNPTHETVWEFDVTSHIQAVVNGATWRGWMIRCNTSTTPRPLYSLNAGKNKPVLTVEWAMQPSKPTVLTPSGDRIVTAAAPIVGCDFTDPTGSSAIDALQVQVDAADDFGSPDFDSGTVLVTAPELDLSTTAYSGLTAGSTTFWRVRVRNEAGLWSPWSDSAGFGREAKGALTITNPAADPNDYVTEYTPPITWSHTGTTQSAWRVRIAPAASPATILYTSGRRLGTESGHSLPGGVLVDNRSYIATVDTWDQHEREATPDDPQTFIRASRTFDVQFDDGVTGPSSVVATQLGVAPSVKLTWSRATAPDSWTVERDGKAIAVDLEPGDLLTSGTSYAWTDHSASLGAEHDYMVRAVVNGAASDDHTPASVTISATGIWVGVPDDEGDADWFYVRGNGISWEHQEDAMTFAPIGSNRVVRVVTGQRGLEGNVQGPMRPGYGYTLDQLRAAVWRAKERPETVCRLAAGDVNIPVVLGMVSMRPHEQTRPGSPVDHVSFEFWQVGELPFEVRL